MAIDTRTTAQLERDFYLSRTQALGTTPATPFGQLQRTYYINYLNDPTKWNKDTPMTQLEGDWADAYIIAQGGTPSGTNYLSSAWRQLVVVIGQTPGRTISANKRLFFLHAA